MFIEYLLQGTDLFSPPLPPSAQFTCWSPALNITVSGDRVFGR